MGKVVGGAPKSAATANMVAENNPGKMIMTGFGIEGKDLSAQLAEELAAKKNARTRGGSRMLLSEARVNAQEGLSSGTTLG